MSYCTHLLWALPEKCKKTCNVCIRYSHTLSSYTHEWFTWILSTDAKAKQKFLGDKISLKIVIWSLAFLVCNIALEFSKNCFNLLFFCLVKVLCCLFGSLRTSKLLSAILFLISHSIKIDKGVIQPFWNKLIIGMCMANPFYVMTLGLLPAAGLFVESGLH